MCSWLIKVEAEYDLNSKVFSLTTGHFMFILKNSSSLYPKADLRGPWFTQSASGCTMTFWWVTLESPPSLCHSCSLDVHLQCPTFLFAGCLPVLSLIFLPFLQPSLFLSHQYSRYLLFHSKTHQEDTNPNLLCFDSFMAPKNLYQVTDFFSSGWLKG